MVAVGLAAIRPLKHVGSGWEDGLCPCCSGFGRYQAVETDLASCLHLSTTVAVGLAAIRPLKLVHIGTLTEPQ